MARPGEQVPLLSASAFRSPFRAPSCRSRRCPSTVPPVDLDRCGMGPRLGAGAGLGAFLSGPRLDGTARGSRRACEPGAPSWREAGRRSLWLRSSWPRCRRAVLRRMGDRADRGACSAEGSSGGSAGFLEPGPTHAFATSRRPATSISRAPASWMVQVVAQQGGHRRGNARTYVVGRRRHDRHPPDPAGRSGETGPHGGHRRSREPRGPRGGAGRNREGRSPHAPSRRGFPRDSTRAAGPMVRRSTAPPPRASAACCARRRCSKT